ncbi:MAG: CDP-diacylglycerol--glycerol-3-phosphate 3-phosphatidyltransferase [Candidatus Coatesbacteria bacterium]|nr:MAG: CDP-diacylglycerol--glycerol-3-phosphate 3-phosphatidyltransferase [Candidatus Coatesbacteria bacterium]
MLNWPNLLTVSRILAAPVFLIFLLSNSPRDHTIAFALFGGAVVTDMLDGYLARRLNCVTDFGKVMDPLADKVIVVTALVSFASLGAVPLWMVLAIVGRELLIMGFRAVAAARGIYIYATTLAKWKTALQMAAIVGILGHSVAPYWLGAEWPAALDPILDGAVNLTLWAAVVLTLVTGVWYLWKNRQVVASIFLR